MTAAAVRWMVVPWRELERWDYQSNYQRRTLRCAFPLMSIADVMKIRRQLATPQELLSGAVCMVDRVSFDGDIYAGERQKTKMNQWVAEPGDIVVSKIRARQGSVGLVEPAQGRIGVTIHYRVLTPDPSIVLAKYAHLAMRSAYGKAQFLAATGGAMKGEISEEALLKVQLPLPPLSTQRKIVAAWEASRKAAADSATKIAQLERDIEARFLADLGLQAPAQAALPKCFAMRWKDLLRWSVRFNALSTTSIDLSTGKYDMATLGEVAAVSYGIQKCPANRPGQHPRPYLRVANVQRGELDLREIKYIDVQDSELPNLRLEPGDLVVCEGNSADLVGRPALWRGEIPDCVHQNHILKVRIDKKRALPEFVLECMHSVPARNHFRARAKFTTNLASINSNDLRELPLPLPPLPIQRKIVERVAGQREEVARLKAEAAAGAEAARAEVEAMILGVQPVT